MQAQPRLLHSEDQVSVQPRTRLGRVSAQTRSAHSPVAPAQRQPWQREQLLMEYETQVMPSEEMCVWTLIPAGISM